MQDFFEKFGTSYYLRRSMQKRAQLAKEAVDYLEYAGVLTKRAYGEPYATGPGSYGMQPVSMEQPMPMPYRPQYAPRSNDSHLGAAAAGAAIAGGLGYGATQLANQARIDAISDKVIEGGMGGKAKGWADDAIKAAGGKDKFKEMMSSGDIEGNAKFLGEHVSPENLKRGTRRVNAGQKMINRIKGSNLKWGIGGAAALAGGLLAHSIASSGDEY